MYKTPQKTGKSLAMPKKADDQPIDTALNEFLYTALYLAPYEQKRDLKGKYLKASMSEKAAKTFATKSNREEKEYMMAHLGYEFFYVVKPIGSALNDMKKMLPILENGSKSRASKAISEKRVFITSDRDILRVLGLGSRTIHHPSFSLDMEMSRQGYHIRKWDKRYSTDQDNAFREADNTSRQVCRTMMNAALTLESCHGLLGCAPNELKILLYLYATTAIETREENLREFFLGRMTDAQFRRAIRDLMYSTCVHRLKGGIAITGSGIRKVSGYLSSVIHSNNF